MSCDASQCVFPPLTPFLFDIEGVHNLENQQENEEKRRHVVAIFYCFYEWFCCLINTLCIPNDSYDGFIFTKQSKTKVEGIVNAIIYGISIMIIYVALGVGVSSIFGADALNNMATNVYFNIGFFYY